MVFTSLILFFQTVTRDLLIEDIHGKSCRAQQIFAESIRFLREHFLKIIKLRDIKIREDDICYTVTLPAIWSDSAKQFMKEAAVEVHIHQQLNITDPWWFFDFVFCFLPFKYS